MSLEFAVISIVAITCLMILAMLLRTKSRGNTQYKAIEFDYEGDNWKIVIRVARFWWLLYVRVKVVPGDLLSFRPQLAYKVCRNGHAIMALPNFWADHTGIAFCKATNTDCLAMQIEVALKDLAMAHALERRLIDMGHSAIVRHNLVIFTNAIYQKP